MKHLFKLVIIGLVLGMGTSYAQNSRKLNNFRDPGKDGVNVFETPKDTASVFDGVKVRVGGAFALQFQALDHSNDGSAVLLKEIGNNFNLATANLDFDIALTDGVNVHLRSYLSSQHHEETWVKGGYIQIDNLNFVKEGFLSDFMKMATIKIGHMEVNYGDAHFRRTDNASALYNPFVGNTILDPFDTEVGGELYLKNNSWLGMIGATNGKLNQSVEKPGSTSPSIVAKLGYDKQINMDFRFRFTGSLYHTAQNAGTHLYGGDRTGTRYYNVLVADGATNFRAGRFDPGFKNQLTAIMFNPFIKYNGFEFFGMYEISKGKTAAETSKRTWNQYLVETLYRFGNNENMYIGARYNSANGELNGGGDVTIDRFNIGAGWFMTKNVIAKLEYVTQNYDGFDTTSIYHNGKFNGFVFEAAISF